MMTAVEVPTMNMYQHLTKRVDRLELKLHRDASATPAHPKYFTRKQTAEVLGVSVRTVDYLTKNGTLETRREGARKGKVMVSVESIGKYQASKGLTREYINERLMEVAYGSN